MFAATGWYWCGRQGDLDVNRATYQCMVHDMNACILLKFVAPHPLEVHTGIRRTCYLHPPRPYLFCSYGSTWMNCTLEFSMLVGPFKLSGRLEGCRTGDCARRQHLNPRTAQW
ncbi:hypothetical protein SLA2020_454860 [Shorea laevis]